MSDDAATADLPASRHRAETKSAQSGRRKYDNTWIHSTDALEGERSMHKDPLSMSRRELNDKHVRAPADLTKALELLSEAQTGWFWAHSTATEQVADRGLGGRTANLALPPSPVHRQRARMSIG